MNIKKPRKYNLSNRSKAAEKTAENIISAIGKLWLKYSIHDITLDMIADLSGVNVRTILRKYGSKDGLLEAALQHDVAGIQSIKDQAVAGDVENIVSVLMEEYELTGMAGIRTLAIENDLPLAGKILQKGRLIHKKWCERVFAPYLNPDDSEKKDILLGAFYAATDIYKWKLLRIDLKYDKDQTQKIFIETLKSLTKTV
jgi:AcrR family transcriptional regulator